MNFSSVLAVILSVTRPTTAVRLLEVITLGVLDNAFMGSLQYTSDVIDKSVQYFRRKHEQQFNLSHTYLVDRNISTCDELADQTEFMLAEWYYKQRTNADLFVFVSPSCTETAQVNRLLASWDILMMTSVGNNAALIHKKTQSPTWVSNAPTPLTSMLAMYVNILHLFKWKNVCIIHDQSSPIGYAIVLIQLLRVLREQNVQFDLLRINSKLSSNVSAELATFRTSARVLLFLGYGTILRKLVIQAASLGMTGDEYVYIGMAFFTLKRYGDFSWRANDSSDETARQAFRSVLIIAPESSVNSLPRDFSLTDINFGYVSAFNGSLPIGDIPVSFVASTFACFVLLGMILDEVLTVDPAFDFKQGSTLAKRFLDRSFDLNFTSIYFDGSGERLIPLELNDLDFETGPFQPVLFQHARNMTLVKLRPIDWAGPKGWFSTVPLDIPVCGFAGDRGPCAAGSQISPRAELYCSLIAIAALTSLAWRCVVYFRSKMARETCIAEQWLNKDEITHGIQKPISRSLRE